MTGWVRPDRRLQLGSATADRIAEFGVALTVPLPATLVRVRAAEVG